MTMIDGMAPKAMKVARDLKVKQPPLPAWVTTVRPSQTRAMDEVMAEFDRGSRVVFLDAPTGTGKSLIGELVRRELDVARGLYVCTTKSLQGQLLDDFPFARVLKGRANYTPSKMGENRQHERWRQERESGSALTVTCGDCDRAPAGVPMDEQSCSYCWAVEDCPYQVARREALMAPVGVLNTAYLLAHCNRTRPGPMSFHGRELVVADEADMLEEQLMGFVELRLGKRMATELGVEVPKKGSHMTTIRAWLEEDVKEKLEAHVKGLRAQGGLESRRAADRGGQLLMDITRVIDREDGWVREGDEEGDRSPDALVLKPVSVEDVGERFLWRHGENWLCMSGTIVSADMMADALGLEAAGIPWGVVDVPMGFARENRRVVYVPAGEMTRKGQEAGALTKVLRALDRVLEKHPGVNVLVHTHTYKLAKEVTEHLRAGDDARRVETYASSWERDGALARFRKAAGNGGAVLVASSMDRGVDLPGDACRVQVVVKMPMASLGSRQVGERMRQPGGQLWYLANTVRGLVQMTGRAVRSDDDWAVTYVLDSYFGKVLGDSKKWGLFAGWWLDGLELGRMREYM
jgi:Rad3-related DNA helicase